MAIIKDIDQINSPSGSLVISDPVSIPGSLSLDNPLIMLQSATPANPAALHDKLYFKADDKLYALDSAGSEVLIGPAVVPSSWLLAGNTGTTPGVDFLGTTDALDVVFKTNSIERMRLNDTSVSVDITGSINATKSVTDSGVSAGLFSASSHTTVDGSNTTIGMNGNATAIVDVGFTNDKAVTGMNAVTTRGNGADDGTLDTISGSTNLIFHNSGAAGVTSKGYGSAVFTFLQQGTITDYYDFYSETVPAGTGAITNHYGVYIKPDPNVTIQSWIAGNTKIGGASFSAPAVPFDVAGSIKTDTSVLFRDPAGVNSVTIQAPALAAPYTLTLPVDDGNPGEVLTTDGGGGTSWSAALTNALTDSHILVGNAGNIATDVAVSGDLTLANTGAFTIANLAVTNAKIANSTIDLTAKVTGVLPIANGGTNSSAALANGKVMVSSAGAIVEGATPSADLVRLDAPPPLKLYIDFLNGNDVTGDGSITAPFKTITKANAVATPNINAPYVFYLSGGNNDSDAAPILLQPNISFYSDYSIQVGQPITMAAGISTNDSATFTNITFIGTFTWIRNDASIMTLTFNNSQFFSGPVFKQNGSGSASITGNSAVFVNLDLKGGPTGSFFQNCTFLGTTTFEDADSSAYYQIQAGYISSAMSVAGGAGLYLSGVQADVPFGYTLTGITTANGTPLIQTDDASVPPTIAGSFTTNLQSHSQWTAYSPTTAGNWNSVPTTVLGGLDTLATSGVVKSQAQNLFLASPNGSAGLPSFRAIVAADLPGGVVSPLTTKGDLYTYAAADARLPVGANNTLLVADSAQATGLKYSSVDLASSMVSGVLPIAVGGTSSSTALNNNRVMVSSGGAIAEAAAITANRALASSASGLPVASATTDTELGYVSGVTSSIQTQLNAKQASFTWFQEVVPGTVDNSNVTFTLSHVPVSNGAAKVYLDGLILNQGVDYTIAGAVITMTVAPNFGQVVYADYVY